MKILLWNVNGVRAINKKKVYNEKTFEEYIYSKKCDFICLNETKIDEEKVKENNILDKYKYKYYSCASKKGYSGVAIFTNNKPISSIVNWDNEGRVCILEYKNFILVCVYVVNSGTKLKRLDYRLSWDKKFHNLVYKLRKNKKVIICGDMNVASEDIDIYKAAGHERTAGFTIEEKTSFKKLCKSFIDSYRYLYPHKQEFTYYDYRSKARSRNAGWRIDSFLIDERIINKVNKIKIDNKVTGSDHLSIICDIEINI